MQIGDLYIRFEIIVAAAIFLFIVLVVLGRRASAKRFGQQAAAMEQEAMRRGWSYESWRSAGGSETRHKFRGETRGIAWQVESCYISGDETSSSYTRWWTEAANLPGEAVLLMPRGAPDAQSGWRGVKIGEGGALVQMAWRLIVKSLLHVDENDVRLLEKVSRVQAGSDLLRKRFSVLASSEAAASRVLNRVVEESLVGWAKWQSADRKHPRLVATVFWEKGVQMTLDRMITDLDQVEMLAQLGAALAKQMRG